MVTARVTDAPGGQTLRILLSNNNVFYLHRFSIHVHRPYSGLVNQKKTSQCRGRQRAKKEMLMPTSLKIRRTTTPLDQCVKDE